ncbi:hypothetical protein D1007_12355 [Hordeum vulgare]|nr:hypothetical protein D1007_12355 [Hordeum vulgare]
MLMGIIGFDLSGRSSRLRAKQQAMPIAHLAEQLICQRTGIVGSWEKVTQEALSRYLAMFNVQVLDFVIAALRALFRMDYNLATPAEEALLQHGGYAGPDMPTHAKEEFVDAARW